MSIGLTSATGPGYTITNLTLLGALNYNAPYTIMGWIYVKTCYPDQTVFSLNDNTTSLVNTTDTKNRDVFMLATAGTATAPGAAMNVRAYSTTAGVSTLLSTTTTLPIKQNIWHHVALVRPSTLSLEAYVDGVRVIGNGNSIGSRTTTIKRFDIGRDPLTGNGIIGRVAHIKVWTRVLTQAEIAQEMGYAAPVNAVSLFAWYPTRLNAGVSRGNDFSGNGKTLSLSTVGTTPTPVDDANPTNVVMRFNRLTGTLFSSGNNRKQIIRQHTAILSMLHVPRRNIVRRHGAILSFQGEGSRGFFKDLGGVLDFTGDSVKGYVRTLIANLSFAKSLNTIKARITSIGGTLRFVGTHRRQITKRLSGTLPMTGSTGRSMLRKLGGVLLMVGLFPRNQIIKLVRTLRFNGFLNKFSDKHLIVRAIHLVGGWIASIGLAGNWKTDHDLDGEIDE